MESPRRVSRYLTVHGLCPAGLGGETNVSELYDVLCAHESCVHMCMCVLAASVCVMKMGSEKIAVITA